MPILTKQNIQSINNGKRIWYFEGWQHRLLHQECHGYQLQLELHLLSFRGYSLSHRRVHGGHDYNRLGSGGEHVSNSIWLRGMVWMTS